jgi:hypothetical protein
MVDPNLIIIKRVCNGQQAAEGLTETFAYVEKVFAA